MRKVRVNHFAGFGLAFDIEKTETTQSGFMPALTDLGAGKRLFGNMRLQGFAAALTSGFVDTLYIVGGNEKRYEGETVKIQETDVPLNRAWAIREMLVKDYAMSPTRVQWCSSVGNTGGNVAVIDESIKGMMMDGSELNFVVISNHYHLPRAQLDLLAVDRRPAFMSAEALWLANADNEYEQKIRKSELISRFGGGPLAERVTEEINGLADKLLGTYQPRIDIPQPEAPCKVCA